MSKKRTRKQSKKTDSDITEHRRKLKHEKFWAKVWERFDHWCNLRDRKCSKCGRSVKDYPDWTEQQKKIEKLVGIQLGDKK